jgi:sugar lactone lactonase YvrE
MNKHLAGKRMHRSSGLLLAAAAGVSLVPAIGHAQVTFLNSFGSSGSGDGQFDDPDGVAVSASGNVYVADAGNGRVEIFNSFGDYQSSLDGSGSEQLGYATGVAVSASGNVYVTDFYNYRVEIFDSSGDYQSSFGSFGSGGGEFFQPAGVAVNGSGNVYVTDSFFSHVETFDSSGDYQSTFGSLGTGSGQLESPDDVAVSGSGNVYIADTGNDRVDIFNSSDVYQSSIGSSGSGGGQFDNPYAVAVSGNGNIYVADTGNDRVEIFNSSGGYQSSFGSLGSGNGQFNGPQGLAVSDSGMVYVSDYNNNRVERFFDPSAWVSGTNTFTDPTAGPTSLDVGPGEILGTSLALNASMGLVVGNNLNVDSSGTLTLSGGSLTVDNAESLQGNGASVTQNTGSSNACEGLYIGNTTGGGIDAIFNLNGGMLTSTGVPEYVGYGFTGSAGEGDLFQYGGSNQTPELDVGYSSTGVTGQYYLFTGATLTVSGNEYIGVLSQGTFDQYGGTNTIGSNLYIGGKTSSSVGEYSILSGSLSAANVYVGGSGSAGVLDFSNSTLTFSGTLNIVNTGGSYVFQAGGSITTGNTVNASTYYEAEGVANLGPLTGTGSLIVGAISQSEASASMTVSTLNQSSVTINAMGTLKITGGSDNTINTLTMNGGQLDITNTRLFIDYGSGPDPIASIEQWIANGYYNLPGPQIIRSDILADDVLSGLSYGIGYADGADGIVAGLPSGEIEIMYTLLGDANLDGTVNSEDFSQFSHNLGQSGMSWDDGDFNYDGTVNSEDFSAFSHNLGQTASLAAAGVLEAGNGINLTNVPEPTAIGLLTLGPVSVLARRRRRANP